MPLSAALRSEIEQAANRNGFPALPALRGEWLVLRSPFTRHELLAGYDGGRFLVATFSRVIADEAKRDWPSAPAPPGATAAFAAESSSKLHSLVQRLFQLARSLPPEPLAEFETKTRDLPHTTEAERLVIVRVGQDIFRDSLMQYWNGRCPLTGIAEPELLRASHIVPWAACESDPERLDVHNGLLLSALWDAAFDKGLISFADDGTPLISSQLSPQARTALNLDNAPRLAGLRDAHLLRLKRHRLTNGFPS
jgi:hypothetical protein